MGKDIIDRQEAIEALGEEPEVWSGNDEYAQGLNNQWHYDVNALKALPSAQPEGWIEQNKDRILKAGMEGREVEFRIDGRLFAIREKAQ